MKDTQTNWIACFHRLVICWDEICPLSLFYIEQLLSHEMWASPFISAKDRRSKRFLYLLSELAGTVTKKNQSGKLSDSCSQGNCIYAKNKVESQCRKVIKGYKRSSLSKWWKKFHAVIVCAVWFETAPQISIPRGEPVISPRHKIYFSKKSHCYTEHYHSLSTLRETSRAKTPLYWAKMTFKNIFWETVKWYCGPHID